MVISPIIKIFSSTELNEGSASFELYWLPVIFYLSGCPSICLRFTLKWKNIWINLYYLIFKQKQYSFTSLYFHLKE